MAKFCGKCGSKLDETTLLCQNCDSDKIKALNEKSQPVQRPKVNQEKIIENRIQLSKKASKKAQKKEKLANLTTGQKVRRILIKVILGIFLFILLAVGAIVTLEYFNIVDIPILFNEKAVISTQKINSGYVPKEENIIYYNKEETYGYVNNMVLVFFDKDATEEEINSIVKSINGNVVGKISGINQYQIEVDATDEEYLKSICKLLMQSNIVYNAIIDYVTSAEVSDFTPNDPWNNKSWGSSDVEWNEDNPKGTNWWFEATKVLSAWNSCDELSSIKVGVVDNGFDTDHEDLNISVLNESVNVPEDHGTHVSGIIGATINNNVGISGILDKVELYGVDCFATSKQEKAKMTVSSRIEGICLCLDKKCKVINYSVGADYSEKNKEHREEWAELFAEYLICMVDNYDDFLIVEAAGNGDYFGKGVDSKDYNGQFSSVDEEAVKSTFKKLEKKGVKTKHDISVKDVMESFMIVAAVDDKKKDEKYQLTKFSNYGEAITVCAPGKNIYSTISSKKLYHSLDGTSMAAPIVSGITALVWSVNPSLTSGQVKDIIVKTADTEVLSRLKKDTGTYHMINAKKAVKAAQDQISSVAEEKKNEGNFVLEDIPTDAVAFNGHWYKVVQDDSISDWNAASQYCNNQNGYIATITSQEENDFLYSYIKQEGYLNAYFGLTDAKSENNWIWGNGEDVSYINWHYNEPNSENHNENYAMFYNKYSDGSWNDGDFESETVTGGKAFICEWGEYTVNSGDTQKKDPMRSIPDERDIVLVLDVSGSMSGTPLSETKKASEKFFSTVLKEDASVGIVTYDSQSICIADFCKNEEYLTTAVQNLDTGGETNIEAGLAQAHSMLQGSKAKKKIIVLMSDGVPNNGMVDEDLISYADSIKKDGTYIYTLGFFESLVNDKSSAQILMEKLASDGCHYEVADADNLVYFFGDIADQINGQKYIYIRIACPVDVSVSYDGQTLDSREDMLNSRTDFGSLSFEENEEYKEYKQYKEYELNSSELQSSKDSRIKILRLKEGIDYDVSIEGNGRGTMDYTIGFMDENGEYSDLRKFTNITITKKTVVDTVAKPSNNTVLKVDEDGDGKYDYKYSAGENEYGKLVDYTFIQYIILSAVGVVVILLAIAVVRKKAKKRKAA